MALDPYDPWEYFGTSSSSALEALRDRLGASYASTPDDDALLRLLARAVEYLQRTTGRFFIERYGSLEMDGTDAPVLWLPHPVIATSQGGRGVVAIRYVDDDTDLDADSYAVNDGAWDGADDPRNNPKVERVTQPRTSTPPIQYGRAAVWSAGVRNIRVTATWGYLDESGETPELIKHALARLVVWCNASPDSPEDLEDRKRAAIVSESVRGRSYTLGAHAAGGGVTLDREVDGILRSFRRPPEARVSRAPRRAARSRYYF